MSIPDNISSILLESHASGLIGINCSVLLYGSQIVQTFMYYDTFHKDPIWMRLFVGFLLIADLIHTMFGCGWIFRLMILDFGDLEAWAYADWLIRTGPAMGGIINAACQLFFAWRIYVLTKNWYISGFVAVLGVAVLVGGLGIAIRLTFHNDLRQQESFRSWVILWLLPGMIADIIITITMTYFLRRRRSGFHQTDTIITRILRVTVQNCLLTTLFATADLTAFLASNKGYHIGISYLVPKLYSNAVLCSLNSRNRLRNMGSDWENNMTTPSHLELENRTEGPSSHSRGRSGRQDIYDLSSPTTMAPSPKVYIDVETDVVTDDVKTPPV